MAARKKPAGEIQGTSIMVRVTKDLKKNLDDMANETGISISERARKHLEEDVKRWKAGKHPQHVSR